MEIPPPPTAAAPASSARTCLVVLGMHRSGTSALTRALSLLGAALPKHLMPAVAGNNDTGFWESQPLSRAHDLLLEEAGSGWDDWRPFDFDRLAPERRQYHLDNLGSIFDQEFGEAPLTVFKDPRVCRLLPLYRELFAARDIRPVAVLTYRNPLAVVRSLARRDDMTGVYASLLWLRHVLESERHSRDLPRYSISYEALMADWRGSLDRLGAALPVVWPETVEAIAAGMRNHLRADLQHHPVTREDLADSALVPEWLTRCHDALERLQDDPADIAAMTALDEVRSEFDAALPVFGEAAYPEIHVRGVKSRQRLAAARQELIDERRRREEELREREEARAHLESHLQRRVRDYEGELAERRLEAERQQASVRRQQDEIARLEQSLTRAANTLSVRQQELAAIRQSRSWRWTAPLRRLGERLQQARLYGGRSLQLEALDASEAEGRSGRWLLADAAAVLRLRWQPAHGLPIGCYRLRGKVLAPPTSLPRGWIHANTATHGTPDQEIPLELHRRGASRVVVGQFVLQRWASGLRWAPGIPGGELWVRRLRLRRITRFERYGGALLRLLLSRLRHPGRLWHNLRTTVGILRRDGWRGLAGTLRGSSAHEPRPAAPQRAALPPRIAVRRFDGRPPLPNAHGNVLLVGHHSTGPAFGAEQSLVDLAHALTGCGLDVHVCIPHANPSYIERLLPHAVSVVVFRYRWWHGDRPPSASAVREFEFLIGDLSIDAVHVNTIVIRDALIAARNLGVPSLVHAREIILEDPDLARALGMSPESIARRVAEGSDHLIANSRATQAAFPGARRSWLAYNVADIEALDLPPRSRREDLRVGLISSNNPKKGLADFARLAALAEELLPSVRFLLIGPETKHVQQLAATLGWRALPANLEIAGLAESPRAALEQVDIVVNFSRFAESFGRTVAEAMAARRPVIVYDRGALPELVEDGVQGYVIPADVPEAALPPLRALAEDPELLARMGEAGRQRAIQEYAPAVLERSLREIYAAVLEECRPSACRSDGALRIAYFLWHFPVPSETFVLNEIRALVEQGHDVEVYCRDSPHADFRPDFPITWQRVSSPEELADRLIASERQIAHAHFTYPTVTSYLWPACERAGIPFTFIAHAQDIFRHGNAEKNRIAEIARSPQCLRVIVPGRFHHAYLRERGVPTDKLFINPQLCDAEDLIALPGADAIGHRHDRRRICAVQRLVEKKGLQYLVEAGPALAELGIEVNLYGYGPLEDELAQRIRALGLDNVHLRGPVETRQQLVEVFAEHDLLIAPSVRAADGDMDGVPTVLMEAMGTGLPVLTTTVASIPDLVRDGIEGILCPPEDPAALVEGLRRFYALGPARIRAMTERARVAVETAFGRERLIGNLLRLWRGETVDLLIVSWNHLRELREVVDRVLARTTLPYRLIICDNDSGEDVVDYLDALAREHSRVHVIHRGYNSYVGPGTNTAMAAGNSRYGIYLCGKEGYAMHFGWELALIEWMDAHPQVGIAGTLGYSPSYLTGRMYAEQHPGFAHFRNPEFAQQNPDRIFRHVQGGAFILRRAMWEEIGGFSEALPHQHTDTEYSYYVESRGWRLGAIPEMLSLYNKTRPGLLARVDENVRLLHPGSPELAPLLEDIAAARIRLCNLCEWHGDRFEDEDRQPVCPSCGSLPAQRTLWRYLAESVLTYRGLSGLYVTPHPSLSAIWARQFGGHELATLDAAPEALSLPSSLDLIVFDGATAPQATAGLDAALQRLQPDGVLLHWLDSRDSDVSIAAAFAAAGLVRSPDVRYASSVLRFEDRPLAVWTKPGVAAAGG